jgi:hypothetical protein
MAVVWYKGLHGNPEWLNILLLVAVAMAVLAAIAGYLYHRSKGLR